MEFPRDLYLGFFYFCYTNIAENIQCELGVFADDSYQNITILKVGRVRSNGGKAFQSCGGLQK